ncbi:hypothetical protein NP233_g7036 [Leucocoprinus birnbaumii]|uniref:Nephrocystin 3-like N-terminal domain-containing protein n=1 Tax=Leucocoprinus birnbaumii TaxID=56174 RepID=A0AAD5VQ08_9AGAR|nr:hypothetical protein NP233_g7036 [Leucocoprinus birnbaumii]
MFEGAHNLAFYNPTFIGNAGQMPGKLGLDKLLAHSMRGAFHDSSDRWPPPRCHYDSRQEIRSIILDWGTGRSETIKQFLLWMHGAFGVGKSAVAQNSAEALEKEKKLIASLFFSRPNHRNNPNQIFPSLAYQFALRCPQFVDIVNREVMNNPTILTAALPHQFQQLIVTPLRQILSEVDIDIEGSVIILDGLDEINGTDAQCDIIDIIATSIRDRTTPFRWFILSRPEAHIQRAMRARNVTPLLRALDLPLSSEDDHEILTFFMKELQIIGEQRGLPPTWCSDADFAVLVKLAGGLWIYVNTVTRFIGNTNSLGPHRQLRLVLSLAQKQRKPLSTNPLAAMDMFYNLIMDQIPPEVASTVSKILLFKALNPACDFKLFEILAITNILQLTIEEFMTACDFLQSVLFVQNDEGHPSEIAFYHASFMEFVQSSERSGRYCIFGEALEDLQPEVVNRVLTVLQSGNIGDSLDVNLSWDPQGDLNREDQKPYFTIYVMISLMLSLCADQASAISPLTAAILTDVDFSLVSRFLKLCFEKLALSDLQYDYNLFRENLPPEYRDKIIRKSANPLHPKESQNPRAEHVFILGSGPRELICWPKEDDEDVVDTHMTEETEETSVLDIEEVQVQETEGMRVSEPTGTEAPDMGKLMLREIEGPGAPETEEVRTMDREGNERRKSPGIKGRRQWKWIPKWLRALNSPNTVMAAGCRPTIFLQLRLFAPVTITPSDCAAMSDVPLTSSRMFDGAHDMAFYHPTFVSNTLNHMPGKQGLAILLAHSMRDAFHDSSDRWPPPRCHYDSRQELLKTITHWGRGQSGASSKLLLWMHGPFGVGKSAVGQNSAEAFEKLEKLAASVFFSRPNRRNNPIRVFTSIIYQLVLKCPQLADILDHKILNNPTILTAALPRQFEELIVKPLRQISSQVTDMEGWVIILDGFDEVDGIEAQCHIIDIIATSIHDRTTPFRWFIISRPEPHIQRAMRATDVTPLLHTIELPLSPENDHEILTFLMKELQKISEKHGLPPSWCTESEFAVLVKLAGGLWIYVNTITRFIEDANSLGPRAQLHLVLSLAEEQTRPLATNPLAAMDLFYDLIMEQIPSHVLPTAHKILLLQSTFTDMLRSDQRDLEALVIVNLLRLSIEEFSAACNFLQSVLFVASSDQGWHIQFYHASFMEYALDPGRSKQFCIVEDSLESLRLEVIERVNSVHGCSTDGVLNLNFTSLGSIIRDDKPGSWNTDASIYHAVIKIMFRLCEFRGYAITPLTATALQNVTFSYIPRFMRRSGYANLLVEYTYLRDNLPLEYRDKIIRKSTNPLHLKSKPGLTGNSHAFILGTVPNGLISWPCEHHENTVDIRVKLFITVSSQIAHIFPIV